MKTDEQEEYELKTLDKTPVGHMEEGTGPETE